MYEMKDEYLTGVPMIDEEHTRLFEIAEEAYQISKQEFVPDKYDQIQAVLDELKDYTVLHFEHEEAYMESIKHKKLYTQKIQHEGFRRKLEELVRLDELEGDQQEQDKVIDDILKFLTDWLVSHILNNDKLIGKL
ncbi:MAG: hemerythrin family protein [Lachnospiraceae bacterium]|nr:hemerythrin family protein [Lachnospiraceae bacterium]